MLRRSWRSFCEYRGLLSTALLLTTASCMRGIMSGVMSCIEMSVAAAAPSCSEPGASVASASTTVSTAHQHAALLLSLNCFKIITAAEMLCSRR